jgi:hypothetical protein
MLEYGRGYIKALFANSLLVLPLGCTLKLRSLLLVHGVDIYTLSP